MSTTPIGPQRTIDFAVLLAAIYAVLRWASRARALRLCLAAMTLNIGGILAHRLGLIITGWILHAAGVLIAVLILLLFPSEFRYALLRLDAIIRSRRRGSNSAEYAVLAQGIFDLAGTGTGALVVLPRRDVLDGLTAVGTPVSIPVSSEALAAIFQKTSPLHDGAAVIEGGRVVAVNVVLPLTRRGDLPMQYGTRHRAALGLAEQCDALVVVASEQTHEVRIAAGGAMILYHSAAELGEALRNGLMPRDTRQPMRVRMARLLFGHAHIKVAALCLATGFWYLFFVSTGIVIRTIEVPVEFTDISPGLRVVNQSASRVEVELRGNALLIDSLEPRSIVAHVPVGRSIGGAVTVRVTPEALNVDPGIAVDRITPDKISIQLEQ
jgi:diadenylate cyclase